ncbi:MAG TPA: hypothetical protein VI795_01665 [Patescibacteria group bacterium]|nr:hypothetical protein [Patescibacteria group bacterium]
MKKTQLTIFIIPLLLFTVFPFLFAKDVDAQAISLSVSPPIFELMIQPGKEVKQIFTVTNLGGDTTITPKIIYFEPADDLGNINLTDDLSPNWVIYDKEPFKLRGQEKFDFDVRFLPPSDTPEIDHFLTIIFETSESVDLLNQNSSNFKSQIGANILLTVSIDGNPKKSAEIIEFTAPKIIDSLFGKIIYTVKLKNDGNSYWKPNGKIIVDDEIINIAPQNILSGYTRNISCINDQTLINCNLKDKFYLGKITAKLEFSIDEDPKIYQKEAISYSFPFSILGFLIFLLTIIRQRIIFKLWPRKRH